MVDLPPISAPSGRRRAIRRAPAIGQQLLNPRNRGVLHAHQHFRETTALSLMMSLRELALEAPGVLLKSKLGQAITYLKNQWVALTRFTTDCSLPLDNNHAERLLRRIALSRKSSLFMGEGRGDLYAITLSLVQSCRLCKISPEAYLSDVLMCVQNTPISRVQELLPDR